MQTSTRFFKQISILVALLLLSSTVIVSPAMAIDPPPGGAAPDGGTGRTAVVDAPQSSRIMGTIQSGTLLSDRFGVTLALQASWGGATGYSFDWDSFKPTKNANTVDWIEADWYGNWSTTSTQAHSNVRGYFPSGGEWYDVEALYFDNDDQYFYIAIVTSSPHFKDWGNGNAGVGIYDTRVDNGFWVRPGDLSINLGLNSARDERHNSTWSYDYGLDLVHDNRGDLSGGTAAMRDNNLGTSLYRTQNDAGGSDVENPAGSDWYTSGLAHNTTAYWEQTNFDPIYGGLTSLGDATVDYYLYDFGGPLENHAETYVIEATIPRSHFGSNNPGEGDSVSIRWVEGCRNDGNSGDAVIHLDGDVDYAETGDAPDSTNHSNNAPMTYSGDPNDPNPIAANFPTVADPGTTGGGSPNGPYGMCHLVMDNSARLGTQISAERDADQSPDQDVMTNLDPVNDAADLDFPSDDGLILPGSWRDGELATIQYEVTVPATGDPGTRYVNVWFDWNRDGDWADPGVVCRTSGNSADEHVIKNEAVNVAPGNSQTFSTQILPCNPSADDDKIWVRITLSDEPVESNNVRDEFNSFSFSNNDGTANWVSNWREGNESQGSGPAGGEVRVFNGRLCLGPDDDSPSPGLSARREATLSGATSATFSFDYEAFANSSTDHFVVEVRKANGTWAVLESFSGSSSGSRSYDITSYIDFDTDIRFRTSQNYGGTNDLVCFDNVQIAYSTGVEDGRGAGYCYADGETEDWYFSPQTPTGVEIVSFDAIADADAVLATWETASEISLLGFDLERSASPDGPWAQVNDGLIATKSPGSPTGSTYEFLDTEVQGGLTYYYRLVARGTSGETNYHGPISVPVPQIGEPVAPVGPAGVYRVYIPFVSR